MRNRPASVRRAGRPPALRRSSFCRLGGISRKTPEKLSRSGGLGPPQTSGGPLSRDRSCFPIRMQRPAAATQCTRCSAPLPFPAPPRCGSGLAPLRLRSPSPLPLSPVHGILRYWAGERGRELGVRQGSLLFPCLRTGALCCGGSNCHIIGSCLSSLAAVSAPRPVPGQVASPASGSPCGTEDLFSAHPLLSLVPLSLSSPGPALSARCALGFPAPAALIPPASLRRPKKNKRARPVHDVGNTTP